MMQLTRSLTQNRKKLPDGHVLFSRTLKLCEFFTHVLVIWSHNSKIILNMVITPTLINIVIEHIYLQVRWYNHC
jgi:hypothetical protein